MWFGIKAPLAPEEFQGTGSVQVLTQADAVMGDLGFRIYPFSLMKLNDAAA